ncbi:PREDICTED: nibrin isoform X2 [Crocodylus porosus]|nr:PREDICTED: nibrin isoform X2 [Crocodylus porosus]
MWKLVPAAGPGPGELYRLLVGTEYVVGRKSCAILIQNDQSISRNHAVLMVSPPESNLSQSVTVPVLTVKDTSKYGTFVNGEKLLNETSKTLKSGDRVNFGVFESKFRIEYEPLIVCSSCLDVSGKTALNQAILQLGGLVVNEWTEKCTHLAMVSVKVTVKTICALICGRPIIKPDYFVEFIRSVQAKQQLPTLESFYPPVDEPSIGTEKVDLSMRHERKTIFRGKTFMFLNAKQHKKLSPSVILGGGEAKLMTEERKDISLLVAPNVCVIDVGLTDSQALASESARNWIHSVMTVLQSKDLRPIPEAEIGLAVIFGSTERYCNPQKQTVKVIKPATPAANLPRSSISQSLIGEETVPTATNNDSVYVADTEPEELTDSRMEIDKTQMNRKGKTNVLDITTVKETPNTSGNANMGVLFSRIDKVPKFDQKSLSLSPFRTSEVGKNRDRESQQQLNSIKNYFQPATKKRERKEEEEEISSVPKLAKLEDMSLPSSSHTQPITSSTWKSKIEQPQREQYTLDPKTNLLLTETGIKCATESRKSESDKIAAKNISNTKPVSNKRKEQDDLIENTDTLEIVFGSKQLDWEDNMEDPGIEPQANTQKKRRLETDENRIEKENVTGNEGSRILSPDKLHDDSHSLPSKLLLTEFRSLVVSHPRPNVQITAKNNYGELKNYKKFKKVAYPGVGQLPHIIGGSDLIAHNAKRNSELEEWLRQEMEEQNRHEKEESLADDLFRYDPHVKRRR